MKKITIALLLFLFSVGAGYSQVIVGEGNNQEQHAPIEPYYGYTYAQSIYLASEINANGTITSLQWYFSGVSNLETSGNIVVYFGLTDKTEFESESDFIAVADLTQVFSGTIVATGVPGWITINLPTGFAYDGIANLVIAVDENMTDYDDIDDDFYNTNVSGDRTIYAYSDGTNLDPLDPTNDGPGEFPNVERGTSNFVPNIILGGIQQACPNPSAVTVSNVTVTNATATWTAVAGQTAWEVIMQEADLDAPLPTQTGVAVTGTPTYTRTDLVPNTSYRTYVRAICSLELTSGWAASQNFTTLCVFSGDFVQDFDSTAFGAIPNCWSSLNLSSTDYAYVQTTDYNSASGANCIEFYSSDDETAPLYLITPGLTSIGANTHRIKFKAKSPGGYTLIMGTMSDPTDVSTFTALNTYTLNSEYTDYSYTFNTTTTDNFIAFKHGGGTTYTYVFIDDVVWEPIPSQVPGCLADLNVTTNEGCGNFPNLFEWSAVDGADGYYVSIGTSANGGDLVVDNANVYSNLSYSFSGNPGTTYYYKVTPYNALGPAVACFEDNFITYDDGCYCESVPDSYDGSGITLVQLNEAEFTHDPITYYDFSEDGMVEISRGVINSLNITFATGYSYHANVWIDYNDNYTFEPSELVFSGASADVAVSTLNASFLTSLTANLGPHRMRIGSAGYGQETPNPCFNDYGGVTFDFMINVLEAPACLPPSSTTVSNITASTAQVNWVSDATLFNVEYGYAPFAQGAGTLISGITGTSTVLPNLDSQQNYSYYLQSNCGTDGTSPWIGPFGFRTACDAFGDFTEDFTTEEYVEAPECWYSLVNTTSDYAYISVSPSNNNVEMYNSDDENAALYLITPNLTDLPLGNHRVKVKAYSYSEGVSLMIGTMSDPNVESTFTLVQTVPVTENNQEFIVEFTTATTATHVAIKFVGTDSYQSVTMDDFSWEPIPTAAPVCVSDLNVDINSDCGNYPSTFSWSAVPGADFYMLTISTTSGQGIPVNIGNVTSYVMEGDFGTTYYYTLVPGNSFGTATGCVEGSFTTYSDGCHCLSVPSSLDGDGITNVSINDNEFDNAAVTYTDYTEDAEIFLSQGETTNVQITFATGYTYDTNIWIDFNDNYIFESSELLQSGMSTNEEPTDLILTFDIPTDAALGAHRMRIGSADSGQAEPNACYNDSYGVTIDFEVTIQDPLSSGQFDQNVYRVYPNPVKDLLHVNATQNITNVAVYNLIGQQVLLMNMNANKGQVDMSQLATGTYLVKVNTADAVKTIKVIKE
jgi:hypothetical protein